MVQAMVHIVRAARSRSVPFVGRPPRRQPSRRVATLLAALIGLWLLPALALEADDAADAPAAAPRPPAILQVIYIGQPAARVWQALTDKESIDQFSPWPLGSLDLEVGGEIYYGSPDNKLIAGRILEIRPGRLLRHTFAFIADAQESSVTYEIVPLGTDMCKLTVSHSGFKEDNQDYATMVDSWPVILSSLKTLLETGHRLPWPTDSGR
jgi:uncharacterized protein YndB with AHSA1/START domain